MRAKLGSKGPPVFPGPGQIVPMHPSDPERISSRSCSAFMCYLKGMQLLWLYLLRPKTSQKDGFYPVLKY